MNLIALLIQMVAYLIFMVAVIFLLGFFAYFGTLVLERAKLFFRIK